jgi:hypothetical protein
VKSLSVKGQAYRLAALIRPARGYLVLELMFPGGEASAVSPWALLINTNIVIEPATGPVFLRLASP